MSGKRVLVVAFSTILPTMVLAGCMPKLRGSGDVVSQVIELEKFSRIRAGDAFKVRLSQADRTSCEIRIDDNLVEHLNVRQQGDTLILRMDRKHNYSVGKDSMVAIITMPKLAELELSGASEADVTGFRSSEDVRIQLSGASELRGDIQAGQIEIGLSGASELRLSGSAKRGKLKLSGASDADLADFSLGEARVDLSGASDAQVKVAGRLEVEASGASGLVYEGDPQLASVNTSGASSVKRK